MTDDRFLRSFHDLERRFCVRCGEETAFHPERREVTKTHKGVEVTYIKYYARCPVCGESFYDARLHDKNIENLVEAYKEKTADPMP